MSNPILSTKLRNAINNVNHKNLDLEFHIKNIGLNGRKVGCSGFIVNKENGTVVYTTTEESCASWLTYMYRYAKDTKDYGGSHSVNQWTKRKDVTELASCIVKALERDNVEVSRLY